MHDTDTLAGTTGDLAIDIAALTRVEGEGSLRLRVRNGTVEEAHLGIFEAPRYFERLVVGRTPDEVIDIVARICGICPVAYQMTAVHAFEHALSVPIDPAVRALRRLLYCGEWIESHALHVYLLHLPDVLDDQRVPPVIPEVVPVAQPVLPFAEQLVQPNALLVDRLVGILSIGHAVLHPSEIEGVQVVSPFVS